MTHMAVSNSRRAPRVLVTAYATVASTLVLTGVTAPAAMSAEDSGPRWAVVNTESGAPLRYRTHPNTGPSSEIKGRLRDGAHLQIFCHVRGETVSGTYGRSDIWDRTRSGYYVPDVFLYTGSDDPVVPRCGRPERPPENPDPEPKPYAKPSDNPHPAQIGSPGKPTARTTFVSDEIARRTGERHCTPGGSRSSTSDHNTGNALDCTISNAINIRPTAAQREQGWRLAKWLREYATRLDVQYVVWDGKIWNRSRDAEGWRRHPMADKGVRLGHYDHVHVSMQNSRNSN